MGSHNQSQETIELHTDGSYAIDVSYIAYWCSCGKEIVKKVSVQSHHESEWLSFIEGLKHISEARHEDVVLCTDSHVIYNQILNKWKPKKHKKLFKQARKLFDESLPQLEIISTKKNKAHKLIVKQRKKLRPRTIEEHIFNVLTLLGEDPHREGLKRTPERVARFLREMTKGYDMVVHLERTYTEHSDLVVSRGIWFTSICEHHLLPFFGKAYIAYIPRKQRVVGLSKLDKLVEKYAKRLQIQERMTAEIASELWKTLEPYGVMVVVDAVHTCKFIEGYPSGRYVTSALKGVFLWNPAAKEEVLRLIGVDESLR